MWEQVATTMANVSTTPTFNIKYVSTPTATATTTTTTTLTTSLPSSFNGSGFRGLNGSSPATGTHDAAAGTGNKDTYAAANPNHSNTIIAVIGVLVLCVTCAGAVLLGKRGEARRNRCVRVDQVRHAPFVYIVTFPLKWYPNPVPHDLSPFGPTFFYFMG